MWWRWWCSGQWEQSWFLGENLNVDLERTGGQWLDKKIAVAVGTVGLEDISAHFRMRRRAWNWYQRPWALAKQGRLMRSQTDYIPGSDCQIFQNMAFYDQRHNSGALHGHGVYAFWLSKGSVILPIFTAVYMSIHNFLIAGGLFM